MLLLGESEVTRLLPVGSAKVVELLRGYGAADKDGTPLEVSVDTVFPGTPVESEMVEESEIFKVVTEKVGYEYEGKERVVRTGLLLVSERSKLAVELLPVGPSKVVELLVGYGTDVLVDGGELLGKVPVERERPDIDIEPWVYDELDMEVETVGETTVKKGVERLLVPLDSVRMLELDVE